MSKPHVSPYRRNPYPPNRSDNSNRSPYRQQPYKLSQKSKLSHSFIAGDQLPTDKRNIVPKNIDQQLLRTMQKKKVFQPLGYTRLETLVQQNKFLLTENNQLANLLSDRNRIIAALQLKLEQQIAQEVQTLQQIEFQKNRFLEEYALKMRQHNSRNERLMGQITQLNEDIYQLQLKKNRQIDYVKDSYSRQHKSQLDNIFSNHSQTLQLIQIQNNKLKQTISNRQNQIQRLSHQLRSTVQKLKNKTQQLQKTLAHVNHMKKLQLSQQKISYQKIIQDIKRQCQKIQEINNIQFQNQIKKIKKQLLIKNVEAQKLGNDISANHIDTEIKINQLLQEKGDLQNQIQEMSKYQRQRYFDQVQRIKNLTKAQIDSTQNLNKQLRQNLQSQNSKLQQLNQARAIQVQQLKAQINQLRQLNDKQCQDLRQQIKNLKLLLQQQKESYDLQNQTMKIKLAQLRHSDISSLQQYYENQLATMTQELQLKENIIQQNRDKIHAEIQQKAQMRKHFQVQINELMIKIGHLQNRMSIVFVQKKQQLANVGSQMNITSISLLKTAEQKQKYALTSQQQKQRLQKIIQSKDKQIDELNQKIKLMKINHNTQNIHKQQQIQILKKTIQDLQTNLKKQKFFLENQIKKKDSLHKSNKQFYQTQISKVKKQSIEQFNRMIAEVKNEKNIIDEQRIRLKKIQKQLSSELKQQKQFRQQQNIDKQLALHQSMNRINSQKHLQQKGLKQYFQKQKDSRDNQIKDLKQQILQLNNDVRSHLQKQQKLQQKIKTLLQSQQKLRDMEQKVIALGQDNNLIKNLSQIVKNRRK